MAASAPAPTLKLGGTAYPVDTSLPRLQAIEAWCKVSIFALVRAGANRELSIDQMAMIAAAIAVASATDPLFGRVQSLIQYPAFPPLDQLPLIAGAIMEAGLIATLPVLLHPLAKAIGLEAAE